MILACVKMIIRANHYRHLIMSPLHPVKHMAGTLTLDCLSLDSKATMIYVDTFVNSYISVGTQTRSFGKKNVYKLMDWL